MNDPRHEISEVPQRTANVVVHAGFVLAGIVTMLLGPILPILIARWSIKNPPFERQRCYGTPAGTIKPNSSLSIRHPPFWVNFSS
jgi:hypothetical protein